MFPKTSIESSRVSDPAPSGVDASQWYANPYANYDYKHSWWQKLLEGIGFRSKYDEFKESMAVNSAEYSSQLAEKAHNEAYDSASAQALRMRQAGINPDLQGGVDAGASSGMEPDPNGPISPEAEDPAGKVLGFVNTCYSLLTGSIGLAGDFLSLAKMRNDVDAGRISNSSGILDFALSAANNMVESRYPEDNPDAYVSDLVSSIGSMNLSRKQKRQFSAAVSAFYQSAPTQAEHYKAWFNRAKNRQDYFGITSSDRYSEWDDVMRVISDNIMKYSDKIFHTSQRVESRQLQNQESYLNNIDPTLQANVENQTNMRNIESSSIDYILNEAVNSILSDLKDLSDSNKRGHSAAGIALLAFSLFRMMRFSSSSTSGVDAISGNSYNQSTSTFGF